MKPVWLYLAAIFLTVASCPDVRRVGYAPKDSQASVQVKSAEVIPSECETKIKAFAQIAETYTGKPAPVILEKSARLFDAETGTYPTNYRTKIREAVEAGVNYAGKYVVAEWGIGTGLQGHAIINAETGRVISYGLKSNEGVDFSKTSTVLIINPKRNFLALPDRTESQMYAKRFKRDYYTIQNDSLVLVCSEPANVGW